MLRGATRYAIFCAVCHGEQGEGSSVVGDNLPKRPPSLVTDPVRALTPAQLYAVVTTGFGQMPSYAAELSISDRWAVIAYVAELQRRGSPP